MMQYSFIQQHQLHNIPHFHMFEFAIKEVNMTVLFINMRGLIINYRN